MASHSKVLLLSSLLIALFSIGYAYFGIICAKYGENPVDDRLIWYYQLFFSTYDGATEMQLWDYGGMVLILLLVGFFLTYREDISLYGVKYTLYFVPITTFFSLLWYWINTGQLGQGLVLLFGNFRGYLTILITIILLGSGSFIGLKFKQYALFKRKIIVINS